ncbi:prephenate dehydrogenase [Mangrovivirga sp. M17]|uniref:Prephenate dehydrogenase n=1 Tax=Mangrovivirga halotolerans TaxID=2993936 RepID=A0ABT3RSM5_9BACT|nr:prephenate dehydrogenase [Mangrovivirga halotolerans]MCX2744247.1 prephenate dehydrogenase [Mangrovivirga halotolerans]
MTIGIIGLGLIGGSLGLALKKLNYKILGFDNNPIHRSAALKYGLIDKGVADIELLLNEAEVIIIATPVTAIEQLVTTLLRSSRSDQVLIDCGSTKKSICEIANLCPNRDRFVAAHPIAGTEFSGPAAAISDLFTGQKMILCDSEKSNKRSLQIARSLFTELGMELIYMPSDEHDIHLAYVSHLSHVSSFALSLTALEIEKSHEQILNLSGSGFASTVRLAKSNPDTWKSIFLANKENLLVAVKEYQNQLSNLQKALENENSEELLKLMTRASEIKKILK